jgi:hypothetical protein
MAKIPLIGGASWQGKFIEAQQTKQTIMVKGDAFKVVQIFNDAIVLARLEAQPSQNGQNSNDSQQT